MLCLTEHELSFDSVYKSVTVFLNQLSSIQNLDVCVFTSMQFFSRSSIIIIQQLFLLVTSVTSIPDIDSFALYYICDWNITTSGV